ncbi:MAG: S-methyl-5-thioribose-1-phosphate isomerase [bacterium]
MNVNGHHYRTIWEEDNNQLELRIIDQRLLPHKFETVLLSNPEMFITAIKDMWVRGAPLIGVTAAYAMYQASIETPNVKDFRNYILGFAQKLKNARPTAVNLEWAVNIQMNIIEKHIDTDECSKQLLISARKIAEDDVHNCRKIGEFGFQIIKEIADKKAKSEEDKTVNILTHCNAGWLATVDWGTATAPIYFAHKEGIKIHVWVDETRPRNQGAKLTSWELNNEGIPNTIIVDNAGGHLMQKGLVDLVIVGSDRTTFTGDVANKIGTYLKALAAKDNNVPFYVALPSSTIDFEIENGINEILIEERNPDEVLFIDGLCDGEIKNVLIPPVDSKASNFAFDITPARLVTGLITERGICKADKKSILNLFPERKK